MHVRKPVDGPAMLIMTLLCLAWGAQQVAIKAIAGDVDPMMQVGLRSAIAAGLVWLVGRKIVGEAWLPGLWCRSGLIVGLLFAAEFLFIAEGLLRTTASHMAVFLYTAPLFAAIGLHIRLPDERLGPRQWLGIALAFIGIAITFLAPRGDTQDAAPLLQGLLGDAMGLCAGAAWGMTTVAVRTSKLSEAPATQTLYYQLMGASLVLLPVAFITGKAGMVLNGVAWASLVFQTLVVAFASYLIWFWMLRRYLAARLGVMAFMTPLFGVLIGMWLLDETTSDGFILGAVLSLVGLLVVNIKSAREHRSPARCNDYALDKQSE
ncbi:DMT family transporter [Pseudomonas putida]|uniref:DMT family transporter n=1 Tax=Pseudomonas putida TaxID=303 RepID=UPI002363EC11|nr:DMT family transporter [Pseudomonas putida]MDD1964080.1 DMT family transporter [Pseudomonas putida]